MKGKIRLLQLLIYFIVTTKCQSVIWSVGEVSIFFWSKCPEANKNHVFASLGRVADTGEARQTAGFLRECQRNLHHLFP